MKDNNWQFVSFDLAKELKKAGYPQSGLWWWCEENANKKEHLLYCNDVFLSKDTHDAIVSMTHPCVYYVAPTVAELGEALPSQCRSWTNGAMWFCKYGLEGQVRIKADTEAIIRAKMWLYLKKEGKL